MMRSPQKLRTTWQLPAGIEVELELDMTYGHPMDAKILALLAEELERASREFLDVPKKEG
ncbi:hypothetical protein SEA_BRUTONGASTER_114 [Gordonia phage BrutonGaster]|uniref:Uncharacterized protein n=1 Tax=Gordonia phage BrutonGaster TaxID=2530116 RepID=A0A482JLP4_9CAUD|nr:hypothetical protein HOV26_gp068 [Gordonia phage BrutonGaster]QBP33329.1 hypothetical protein SEA_BRUTONGASTER_114 [Gordonia phage BrutonGaster]